MSWFWPNSMNRIWYRTRSGRIPVPPPEPFNPFRCQVCGAPGSTICPWCTYKKESPVGDTTRPQQDPKPGKTAITALVIADFEARREQGIKKYGTELMSSNGRDALVDALQEAMDMVMYLRQAIEERDEMNRLSKQVQDGANIVEAQMGASVGMLPGNERALPLVPKPGRFIIVDGYPSKRAFSVTPIPSPNSETILQEAQRLVHGDRGEAYGHPIFDMTRTADMVTALLRDKLRVGMQLEAEDVGQIMVAVKMSRHRHSPKRDNLTDTAGYAETLSMIKAWREANPGLDPRAAY